MATEVTTYSDSDWSGDRETRKSSNAGVIPLTQAERRSLREAAQKRAWRIRIAGSRVDDVRSRIHNESGVGHNVPVLGTEALGRAVTARHAETLRYVSMQHSQTDSSDSKQQQGSDHEIADVDKAQ